MEDSLPRVFGIAAALFAFVLSAPVAAAPPPWERTETREDCADFELTRSPFFGETHVHTNYSTDSVVNGNTNGPREAYGFAQGAALPLTPTNPAATAQLRRTLDFTVVADHAEGMGETSICLDPTHAGYDAPECEVLRADIGVPFTSPLDSDAFLQIFWGTYLPDRPRFDFCGEDESVCLERTSLVWNDIQAAAEEYYDRTEACAFTTFVGYEWSGNTGFTNLHRNVIFRNTEVTDLPISYFEEPTAEGLWDQLRDQCLEAADGCDVLAIPHNSNMSGGGIFVTENPDGSPLSASDAAFRSRMEPLVEITQHKGDSECHPLFSTTDELCSYEKLDQGAQFPGSSIPELNFVRNALSRGLAFEQSLGMNPFQFGVIGSTDGHLGLAGATREDDYAVHGHVGAFDATARLKLLDMSAFHAGTNPGGLAVVWAEENSRDALFSAMRRREVYATSGTRPLLRFFAGDYKEDLCESTSFVETGYSHGVPMGGEIGNLGKGESPTFAVLAVKDPGAPGESGTPLQRIQIVKSWVGQGGTLNEKVYEIAGNSGNGASVDESTCAVSDDGFDSLCSVWTDPDFDSEQRAYYYVRALENPSCRWTTYVCNAQGVDCADPASVPADYQLCCSQELPKTVQERAWSSPIWYRPESVAKLKAVAKVRGQGQDSLVLKATLSRRPMALAPETEDITVELHDDDTIFAVTIAAGTMVEKKAGRKYVLKDSTGALAGVRKAVIKIDRRLQAKLKIKAANIDLSTADLSDHFVRTTLQAGDFRAEHVRLWRGSRRTLGVRN